MLSFGPRCDCVLRRGLRPFTVPHRGTIKSAIEARHGLPDGAERLCRAQRLQGMFGPSLLIATSAIETMHRKLPLEADRSVSTGGWRWRSIRANEASRRQDKPSAGCLRQKLRAPDRLPINAGRIFARSHRKERLHAGHQSRPAPRPFDERSHLARLTARNILTSLLALAAEHSEHR